MAGEMLQLPNKNTDAQGTAPDPLTKCATQNLPSFVSSLVDRNSADLSKLSKCAPPFIRMPLRAAAAMLQTSNQSDNQAQGHAVTSSTSAL